MSNLQMLDFAVRDKRSAAAMLRLKGDGREKYWLKFEEEFEAVMTQEQLHIAFNHGARLGSVGSRKEELIYRIRKYLFSTIAKLASD